ncbi:hypothetical protein [Hymenobacter sp. CRA2]|uniref:hypothetical protein n=1 Tax=Hymenobacter sp. CRA2 TaxID=1955620 RepID=UPI00098FFE8C|nr:hypothetical protein [Hymenobacter sp. CRA2]OON69263.1 hypothetical protein B0919_08175 [Hymenobacter sp. CRA2]
MKPFVYLLLSAGVLAACQRTPEPEQPAVSSAQAAPMPAKAPAAAPIAAESAVAIAPEMTAFLKRYDLSTLWTKGSDDGPFGTLNGFFGADKYRIEFVFTEATRDTLQPHVYHVRGKDRFKDFVTPFEGTVVLERLADQPPLSAALKQEIEDRGYDFGDDEPYKYSAVGHFVLREDVGRAKAGEFRGDVALDFRVDKDGKIAAYAIDKTLPSQGGVVKFSGTWTSYSSGQRKPLVLVEDIMTYGPSIFEDFVLGEREADFNPKYAKLGWNTYWENKEWWAETPTASL